MQDNSIPQLRKYIHRYYLIVAMLALLAALANSPRLAAAEDYELFVSKQQELLTVKLSDKVIKTYRAAIGKGGPGNKNRHGDNITPVGHYKITAFKEDSKFHYFMQLDYPNAVDAWYGYKNELLDAAEFSQIMTSIKDNSPLQNTKLGGYIGIHGIGQTNAEKLLIHNNQNWTQGCIALTNEEINELRQYVTFDTPVIISDW